MMGRHRSRNTNLPPRIRVRHRGDRKYYYYDAGGRPRREIPLGSDYLTAMQRWAELEIEGRDRATQATTFKAVAEQYLKRVIPLKAARTQRDNLAELDHLQNGWGTRIRTWVDGVRVYRKGT